MAAAFLLPLLLGLGEPSHATPEDQAGGSPLPPILIQGDADLCDDEDGDGSVGMDDGIVNCATATGTAEAPYIIEGWTVELNPPYGACVEGITPDCYGETLCDGSDRPAVVSVCDTTQRIRLRDLSVLNVNSGSSNESGSVVPAGINLSGNVNVTLEESVVRAAGTALFATGAGRADSRVTIDRSRFASTDILEGVTLAPHAVDANTIEGHNVDLVVRASDIDATGHRNGLVVRAGELPAHVGPFTILVEDTRIANATVRGAIFEGVTAVVQRSTFLDNGLLAAYIEGTGLFAAQLNFGDGNFNVEDSQFVSRGEGVVGINLDPETTGLGRRNVFRDGQGNSTSTHYALTQAAGSLCEWSARYSDFEGLLVANYADCVLDVRMNWWGQPGGPVTGAPSQAQGPVLTSDALKTPFALLPTIDVLAPRPLAPVYGVFSYRGEAASPDGTTMDHVESSANEDPWSVVVRADIGETWAIEHDVTYTLRGPYTHWFRSCDRLQCGIPVSHPVLVVSPPAAPIAVLEVAARVARVGGLVGLDASASYAHSGAVVEAYRFDVGDGREPAWQDGPRLDAVYDRPGVFRASVEVRDSQALTSVNVPEVVVRILDQGRPLSASLETPAAAGLLPVLLGVLALAGARGWTRRP